MSAKGKIEEALRSAIQEALGSDGGVDVAFTTDPTNDNLIIAVSGLTLDESGEVVLSTKEFEFTGVITISVRGTVTEANEDSAEDAVADWLNELNIRVDDDGWSVTNATLDDWMVEDTEVRGIF